ncbi:GNAT family N-acetyltransferase [Actinokineospora sp.]|uniref:GNAT family N-acetyltransferase n=1 Tax=Actinokineospora sp. TaxID=1872133 RepID=UPI004037BC7B
MTAGTDQTTQVTAGVDLPAMSWEEELHALPDLWPYLGPAWLRATAHALPDARPWHTVATRDGELSAYIAGFWFDSPQAVDFDPRAYLGWQPPSGDTACCDTGASPEGIDPTSVVDGMGASTFFPALILGSPLGFRTEAAGDPELVARMVDELVKTALDNGARSIVAPWIPSRDGNQPLIDALVGHGGHEVFWGQEYHMPLTAQTYADHVEALPSRARVTVNRDHRNFAESGFEIKRLDGEAARPHLRRVAELTCYNRSKYDGHERPEHVEAILLGMLAAKADLRCYAAFQGDTLVGSCVAVRKGDRLVLKWSGFDYELLGRRSGLYFPLIITRPVQDAYAEGLRHAEFGPGSEQVKRRRGCVARGISSVVILAEQQGQVVALLDALGSARRAALRLEPVAAGETACCAAEGDTA